VDESRFIQNNCLAVAALVVGAGDETVCVVTRGAAQRDAEGGTESVAAVHGLVVLVVRDSGRTDLLAAELEELGVRVLERDLGAERRARASMAERRTVRAVRLESLLLELGGRSIRRTVGQLADGGGVTRLLARLEVVVPLGSAERVAQLLRSLSITSLGGDGEGGNGKGNVLKHV